MLHSACHPIKDVFVKRFITTSDVVVNVREVLSALCRAIYMIRHDGKARIGVDGPMDATCALDFNNRRRARFEGNSVKFAAAGQAEPIGAARFHLRAVRLAGLIELRHLHRGISDAVYEVVL